MNAQAPSFREDWSGVRTYWGDLFQQLNLTGKPDLHFLEVGCFEGMATRWLLDNVLTGDGCRITVVDTFQGSAEHEPMGVDTRNLRQRFEDNMGDDGPTGLRGRVTICEGESREVLRDLWNGLAPYTVATGTGGPNRFSFVYIDGSHFSADVLADTVLAWDMLKPGGLLIWDDYLWGKGAPEWQTPAMAVDAFIACFRQELRIVYADYQVAVAKLHKWELPT